MIKRYCIFSLKALLIAGLAAACDFGPVQTVAPDQEGVERIALEATTALESGDSAIADSLGWPAGRVARGTVTIRREKENVLRLDPPQTAVLSDSGIAFYSDLLGGRYWAWGERRLTEEEISKLPEDRQATVRAFGGGGFTTARRAREATELQLPMQANTVDGLVISESSFFVANQQYSYRFFGYIELYNNSTETVYLDGMFIGSGFFWGASDGDPSCAEMNTFLRDPKGFWTRLYQQFPGSGGDHPLQPGETVVVATDAIDHSQVVNDYLDLTEVADFEFHGPSDVDNPDVPNMIRYRPCLPCSGHGFTHQGAAELFVSEPVDPDALPSKRFLGDRQFERIPADRVVDVISNDFMLQANKDWCPTSVHPRFDQMRYWHRDGEENRHLYSLQRPVVGTRPNGQPILLDTNTSAVDLELMRPRTPGELPPRQ